MKRRAFSYARFSTAKQGEGSSLARQLSAAKAYCERNGLVLDDKSFLDLGVSGYHGSNSLAGDLGVFINLVKTGRIPKGSVLIVENTDRLSRLPPDEANRIITTIVKAGVDIVTTAPEQVYTAANIDKLSTWLPLQVSNCLAREESVKKSDRLKDAWQRKRGELASNKKLSKKGPFWLTLSPDRTTWSIVKEHADRVRRMFRWCIEGDGVVRICEKLQKECPGGVTGKSWQPNNIRKLLRSRSVLGEFQPHIGTCAKKGGIKSTRMPSGQPVVGYFPAIIDEATFYKAQAVISGRRRGGGRSTGLPNLFNGILYDARDRMRMVLNSDHGKRVLVSSGAIRKMKGSEFRSFPYDAFEKAMLLFLRELKPADVLGSPTGPTEDEVEVWSGKLASINHHIAKTQERATRAEDPSVFLDLLETYGKQRKEIIAGLEAAKGKLASGSASDALDECTSLATMLDSAKGAEKVELRTRIKAALHRLVTGIWVVVVPRGRVRLADVQVNFVGTDSRRKFRLFYRPSRRTGTHHVDERLAVLTVKHPDDGLPFDTDDLCNIDEVGWTVGGLEKHPMPMIDEELSRHGMTL
ncbi:MAG: recombinase family protein [Gemmataceae bacterium]